MKTGYLAPEGLLKPLLQELRGVESIFDRLVIAEGEPQEVHWAQNIWYDVQILPFTSISDAARQLRALQGLWVPFPHQHHRRAELIQAKLPRFFPKPLSFPAPVPSAPLGSWTLLDENTLLAAARTASPLPHGEYLFHETKEPPSRAYLKLWEILTRLGAMPAKGDLCLELGASPGSWSWVLSSLGASVIAVDRAPLECKLPGVVFRQGDAFQLRPGDFPDVKWVFSDVICYPDKLLGWIEEWLVAGSQAHFICTIKFQGEEQYEAVKRFKAIPGGQIIHLYHNKHELTFVLLRNDI